ncbi:MAG: HAD-IA family hydrolase [Cohaesibacter sp.]|nr:HAD-IA family hydrolase [Cohaesibacter sp.]MCV6601635.1 HAD-IA family hydrolase [Cohaesibacter sp.]
MVKHVFFDLDGTLTDPKPGIVGSIRYALDQLGITEQPHDLDWCIGPPLQESFVQMVPEHLVDEAIVAYRHRFSDVGLYENRVYDGVEEMLQIVRDCGGELFVATSKPHIFARKILDHFGLSPFFSHIFGSELDGTHANKAELLAYALQQSGVDPHCSLMIGDRKHDIVGAHANGIASAGVLWGYGSRCELQQAGAQCILSHMRHLGLLARRGAIGAD